MIDGVNLHMLPHLSGVPHLHVNRPSTVTPDFWQRFSKYSSVMLGKKRLVVERVQRLVYLRSQVARLLYTV